MSDYDFERLFNLGIRMGCRGQIERLEKLVDRHSELITRQGSQFGETLMHDLAVESATDAVRVLLDMGADPNKESRLPTRVLADVVGLGNIEMATLLLERGAIPDIACSATGTVLGDAVESDRPEMVRLLVKHGASIGLHDEYGQCPIMVAAENKNRAMFDLLVSLGAHADCVCDIGTSARERLEMDW